MDPSTDMQVSRAVKRASTSFSKTKQFKRSKNFICDCVIIDPGKCNICAKIARKIHRLFGKRLALSPREISVKATAEPANGGGEDMLVFADQPCDCAELDSDRCTICAAFAIKMGVFMNTYSKKVLEDTKEEWKYKVDCECSYLSATGCGTCRAAIIHIQSIFRKKVYPTCQEINSEGNDTDSSLSSTECDPTSIIASHTHTHTGTSSHTSTETSDRQSKPTDICTTVDGIGSSTSADTLTNTLTSTDTLPITSTSIDTHSSPGTKSCDIGTNSPIITSNSTSGIPDLSRYVALDCEMVGVIDHSQRNIKGRPKMVSALARCSIVDSELNVLLDIYVKPDKTVADYRTKYSGITKAKLKGAVSNDIARDLILSTLQGKIVVGHTLSSDFSAIGYAPPPIMFRDIGRCRLLNHMYKKKSRLSGPGTHLVGLKKLSAILLNSRIQEGSHCSVEDSIHTMRLYLLIRDDWEAELARKGFKKADACDEFSLSYTDSSLYLDDTFWPESNLQC